MTTWQRASANREPNQRIVMQENEGIDMIIDCAVFSPEVRFRSRFTDK